ncbi:hypothetical protein B0H11DRAFT_2222408 [Mycena galericulata]|nr:hypothetical protein B0H11DRAFT_2222408 [Mycena galericulata]
MISESAHLSRASVDSTTALTASYRPPQKDFAAALATLQDAYATPSVGQSLPTLPTIQSKTSTSPADIQPSDTSTSAGEANVKAMSKRILKAVGLTFMKVIGMAGESLFLFICIFGLKPMLPEEKSSASKGESLHSDPS